MFVKWDALIKMKDIILIRSFAETRKILAKQKCT